MLKTTFALFIVLAAVVFAFQSNWLVFTNDEGILLEPAQRAASGLRPYVDFFAYMSPPGSYWLQAAAFRIFGISLRAGRLLVILDFAAQCALLFWIVATFASRRAGLIVTFLFFVFQATVPGLLTPQHRWDSATLATLSIALSIACWRGTGGSPAPLAFLAGMAAAAAALCTPSIALVGLLTAVLLRRRLAAYAAGAACISAAAVVYMLHAGMFTAFLDQIRWLRHNYTAVNGMAYGSVIGGYAGILMGSNPLDTGIRIGLVVCLALPALLPPLNIAAWAARFARKRVDDWEPVGYPLACSIAFAIGTLPRPDLMHLSFAAVPAYALAAIWIARYAPARAAGLVSVWFGLWACLFAFNAASGFARLQTINSPVGQLRVAPDQAGDVRRMLATIHPGDGLYVHPYMPLLYFLTQARNPTRFAFLGPGMMTSVEESQALDQLSLHPPQWIFYLPLTREEFLRVFPGGSGLNQRFERIEAWIQANYQPVQPAVTLSGYQLWSRAPSRTSGSNVLPGESDVRSPPGRSARTLPPAVQSRFPAIPPPGPFPLAVWRIPASRPPGTAREWAPTQTWNRAEIPPASPRALTP
jgi:hypothetical protein